MIHIEKIKKREKREKRESLSDPREAERDE